MEKVFTLTLRKILLCDYIYYFIFIISVIFVFYKINAFNIDYSYLENHSITGVVTDIYVSDSYISFEIDSNYKIKANYYINEDYCLDISLGDKITVHGEIYLPSSNTNINLFSYRDYLKSKNIYYLMNISSYEKISNNRNFLYSIKNYSISLIEKNLSYRYLYAFILGDTRYIDSGFKASYQELGISHLFSVSGMHISILSSIILMILKKIKVSEEGRLFLACIFIIFFMFLVNLCPSVLRSGIFFILVTINSIFYFYIKPINLLLVTVSIIMFLNPYIIYNNGFLYSSIITGSLIMFSSLINKYKSYISKLFMTSFISFLFSFPLSIYNYYQINILSILYNLIFVPLVSIIIFPLSLVCLFFPFLSIFLEIFIKIMEFFACSFSLIDSNIIFIKPSLLILLLYYLLILIMFSFRKKIFYFIFILCLLFHYNYNILFPSNYILMIDVGQGDSILLHSHKYNILMDTGGVSYGESNLAKNTLIPLFKSLGIENIDYLFLSHGDYDHMGEAINLVENFNVEKVIFNCGEFNDLENELIKILDKKKIPYYSCIKELNIDNNKLYFLQTKVYDNENDNSNVIYIELDGYKFMFMGDAGIGVEEDLIEKYDLKDIDVLKVGHHGSKTSSSKSFIDTIEPKYSIISVGKNNRYGHPNTEVLDNLESSKIYRTDQNGSIVFKIDKDKLKIETCKP